VLEASCKLVSIAAALLLSKVFTMVFEKVEKSAPASGSNDNWARSAAAEAYPIGGTAKSTGTDTTPHAKAANLSIDKYCNPNLPPIDTKDWNSNTSSNSRLMFPQGLTPKQPEKPGDAGGTGAPPKTKSPYDEPYEHYKDQQCPPTSDLTS